MRLVVCLVFIWGAAGSFFERIITHIADLEAGNHRSWYEIEMAMKSSYSWDKAKGLILLGSMLSEDHTAREYRNRLDAYLDARSDILQRDIVDEFGAAQIGIVIPSYPPDLPEVMRRTPFGVCCCSFPR